MNSTTHTDGDVPEVPTLRLSRAQMISALEDERARLIVELDAAVLRKADLAKKIAELRDDLAETESSLKALRPRSERSRRGTAGAK
jgi:chromosome segregation ATPase